MTDHPEKDREGFTKQGKAIIGLLSAVVLALVALTATLWLNGTNSGVPSDEKAQQHKSTESAESTEPTEDPEAVEAEATQDIDLAAIELETVHEPPTPNPPEAWGDYTLLNHWQGDFRVFGNSEASSPSGYDGGRWLSSQNHCGVRIYLVTFKAHDDTATLKARLVNGIGTILSEGTMRSGWMLFTNCSTPTFTLADIASPSNLTDVAYDVYEYTQSSVAPPGAHSAPALSHNEEAEAPAEPTFVECVGWYSPLGVYSDGSERYDPDCAEIHERTLKRERWCGPLLAPPDADYDEFVATCGREPQYE